MLRVAEHYSASDTGRERRANEDSYLARSPVFVVADGMGGARAGEVASRTAVELFAGGLDERIPAPEERLARRVQDANERIHELSRADSRRAGMGTTITAVHVGGEELAIAHVGDSRAYCLRDGALSMLTEDHSLVGELVRQGKLTEQEAEEHPQRSIITRALGPEPVVMVDTMTVRARPGDVYLLCSDGLTSMLSDDRLRQLLAGPRSLEQAGVDLIDAANAAGGRDNITVILFRLESVEDPGSGTSYDQPTSVGVAAPTVDAVRRALADSPPVGAVAPAPREPGVRAQRPRPAPEEPRRRRRREVPGLVRLLLGLLVVVGVLGAAFFFANSAIYFVGTDAGGRVAVFNGLPYDLPAGVKLYSTYFVSGVTVAELGAAERSRLLNNQLRSFADATDLVRRVELGQISTR
ncbi:MAG: family protein phosphatase [Solirubrobacteraceae bacterium]|jgi:protein phosphatase|nr:family protein phosphatase [Solirubrobacteraceae bacterium]